MVLCWFGGGLILYCSLSRATHPSRECSKPPDVSLPTRGERDKKLFAALHVSVCRGSLSPQRSVVKRTPSWRWRHECPRETWRSACELRGTLLAANSMRVEMWHLLR